MLPKGGAENLHKIQAGNEPVAGEILALGLLQTHDLGKSPPPHNGQENMLLPLQDANPPHLMPPGYNKAKLRYYEYLVDGFSPTHSKNVSQIGSFP